MRGTEEWVEITALGSPDRIFLVMVSDSTYTLVKRPRYTYTVELWGDWEWQD